MSPQAPTDPIPELEQQVIAGVNDALSLSGAAKLKASRHLRQRLREGATVQECLDVYLWAADTWGKVRGTPSAQYVRPSTLYGKEKFPGYARSAQQWRGGGDTPKPTPTKRRHVRDRRPEITDEEIATLHASGYCDAEGYQ